MPRQRVGHHVRTLESSGLLTRVGDRRKRNCVERLLQASARSYVVAPQILGALGRSAEELRDRFSSSYLLAAAARVLEEVSTLQPRAEAAGKAPPHLTLQSEVRFASARSQNAFVEELIAAFAALVEKHHAPDSSRRPHLPPLALRAPRPAARAPPPRHARSCSHEQRATAPQGRTLDLTVDLPASPEEVWRMLTDPMELARWFAPYVEGSGKVGEPILLGWGPDVRWKTLLTVSEPGRRVVFRDELDAYQGMGPASGPMVIEWTMGPIDGGTRLRLVHSGFGDGASWDEMYDGTASGWALLPLAPRRDAAPPQGQTRITLSARRLEHPEQGCPRRPALRPRGIRAHPTAAHRQGD